MNPTYFLVLDDGARYGPYTIEQLNQYITEKLVLPTSKLISEGGLDAVEARYVPGLIFPIAAAPLIPEQGASGPSPYGQPAPQSAYAPRAASPGPGAPAPMNQAYPRQMPIVDPTIKDHMTKSILVTLCCCIIGGIGAIIYSTRVNAAKKAGDYNEAVKNSKLADQWGNYSIAIGLVAALIRAISLGASFMHR